MIVKNKTHFLLFLLYLYYLQVTPIIYLDLYSTIFILILLILLRFFLHKKYLHSTIFILIPNTKYENMKRVMQFTFYYIYINTKSIDFVLYNINKFTFYYIYINTYISFHMLRFFLYLFTFYYIYINT